jgi:hypothetical protein
MSWEQRLTSAVHSAELDLRRATAQVTHYRRRTTAFRESIKTSRSGCERDMKEWAEFSVETQKQRYLEHKRSRMAIRVKFRHDEQKRRLELGDEEKSYRKEE